MPIIKLMTKKDWLIVALVFFLVFMAASLAVSASLLGFITYADMLSTNPIMWLLAKIGYFLVFPLLTLFITPWFFVALVAEPLPLDGLFYALPFVTAFVYTFFIALGLMFHHEKVSEKK